MSHTPIPWKLTVDGRAGEIVRAADETGKPIASMWINGDSMTDNAAFIVKACNAHEALVEALDKIIKFDTCVSDGGKRHDHGFWASLAIGALESAGLTSPITSAERGTAA